MSALERARTVLSVFLDPAKNRQPMIDHSLARPQINSAIYEN